MKITILSILASLMLIGCTKFTYEDRDYVAKDFVNLEKLSVSVTNVIYKDVHTGVLYVDGKRYEKEDSEKYEVVKVIINGNVGKLDATDVEINGDVSGGIDGTNISITGNVDGDIDGTNVTVGGSVHGDIDATLVM